MRFLSFGAAGLFSMAMAAAAATAQHAVHIDGDEISMRGCVAPSTAPLKISFDTLIWSRGGILTAGTAMAGKAAHAGAPELASRVLYWMDENALDDHVGKLVELRGKLGGIKTGELEIERDGEFTEIRLELDGDDETIRVPTSWLRGPSVASDDDDIEVEIATRKVDVNDVKVLGPCPGR